MLEATRRSAAASSGDSRRRRRREPVDAFGLDRSYEARASVILDFLHDHYFRTETAGIEHIPEEGRCLLVANHSGGPVPIDGLMLRTAVRREHPQSRELRWLSEDAVATLIESFEDEALPALDSPYRVNGAYPQLEGIWLTSGAGLWATTQTSVTPVPDSPAPTIRTSTNSASGIDHKPPITASGSLKILRLLWTIMGRGSTGQEQDPYPRTEPKQSHSRAGGNPDIEEPE